MGPLGMNGMHLDFISSIKACHDLNGMGSDETYANFHSRTKKTVAEGEALHLEQLELLRNDFQSNLT